MKPIYSLTAVDLLNFPGDVGAGIFSLDGDLDTVTYSAGMGSQWVSYLLPASSAVHRVVVYQPYPIAINQMGESKEDAEKVARDDGIKKEEAESEVTSS